MTEDREDRIMLQDEDGNEVEFEYVDTVEWNDKEYVVLTPVTESGDEVSEDEDDDQEVVILRIEHGDDDEDSLVSIEDEGEEEEVFEAFMNKMQDDECGDGEE